MQQLRMTVLFLVAALAACDRSTATQALNPDADDVFGAVHDASTGAVVVRGEASTPSGTGRRILTVDALQNPGGHVTGSYRVDLTASGLFFVVDVSCITADGNTAFVGGHIAESNSAAILIGSVSYFFVTDNGKPHPQQPFTPDELSTARINDAEPRLVEFCETQPRQLPLLAGYEGDIMVR